MGAILGLVLGLGLALIASAFTVPARTPDRRRSARLDDLLVRAGLGPASARGVIGVSFLCGLIGTLTVQALSHTPPVAIIFGLMSGYVPWGLVRSRARRRQQEFAAVWPEVVDQLASGVRAGLGLAEALADLAHRGPDPLRPAFASFATDYQTSGRLAESLERLKARLADPVGDRVIEALRIAREVGGGDLGRLLRNLSHFLREDARTRSELLARQAWAINGARLAVAAPWLVLLLLSFQPAVIQRYASAPGLVVLGAGATACVVAYGLMMRIGRLPVQRRIFAGPSELGDAG